MRDKNKKTVYSGGFYACNTFRNNFSESVVSHVGSALVFWGKLVLYKNIKIKTVYKRIWAREVVKLLWAMTAVTFWNQLCQLQSLLLSLQQRGWRTEGKSQNDRPFYLFSNHILCLWIKQILNVILNQLHWNFLKKELKQKILESLNFWSCGCVPLLIYCIFAQKNFPGSNCW